MKFKSVLFICLVFIGLARAQIVSQDGYSLTTGNINLVIAISEALAETTITNSDKKEIVNWTIEDFKSAPQGAINVYEVLNNWLNILNNTQSQFEYELAKYALYQSLYFDWKIPAAGGYEGFLDIVQRYNPVVYYDNETRLIITGNDQIIAKKDDYPLSKLMQESALKIGEWLARAQFSQADANSLRQWVIDDFNANPLIVVKNYSYFLNDLLPKIYLQNKYAYELEDLREMKYSQFYFAFKNATDADRWNNDLMDVVGRYNPVIIEDRANKLLLTRSAVDEGLIMHEFLERIISSPVVIDDRIVAAEKTSLISSFLNRTDKSSFNSGSWFLVRIRDFWNDLSQNERDIFTKDMKKIYLETGSVQEALNPLFKYLQGAIKLEQTILAQTLYFNQQIFNNTMSIHQQIMNDITTDFVDFSTRQSLQLSGATILSENDGYYEIEYEPGGIKYQVYK